MNAPRCWNLRQGYPIGIAYCAKVSVAPWVQKQYNTFPPFKELSHDEGSADFDRNLRDSPLNKGLSKEITFCKFCFFKIQSEQHSKT
jgi:hypothetical protein